MKAVLLVASLLLAAPVTSPASAGCAHLLVDPAGDVSVGPGMGGHPDLLDDERQVDLRWVELASDRRVLVATLQVAKIDPESDPLLDHYYTVAFSNGGERYELAAAFSRLGGESGEVYHVVAGDDVPEDSDTAGGSAGVGIGPAAVRRDTRKGTVTVTVDLAVFGEVAPLSGSLTTVRAITWSGVGEPFGGTYGSADFGRTSRSYRLGAPACG